MNKKLKIGLWIAGALALIGLGYLAYRMFWMFDSNATGSNVSRLVQADGATDQAGAAVTIQKEIAEILSSQSQTAQILNNAKLTGDTKEKVLAETAYNNAKAKGFL